MAVVWIAAGGALGAASRYVLSEWIGSWIGVSAIGIFVVNITGAFLIGFLMTVTQDRFVIAQHHHAFMMTGILGGYTTFSTWSWQTMQYVQSGDYHRATANGLGSLVAGLVAVYLGILLAQSI